VCTCLSRMNRTKRLRLLFEKMDKNRTGTLTLEEFKEYMGRENPKSMMKATHLFSAMSSDPAAGEKGVPPTISFREVFPTTLLQSITPFEF
jgi:Ca2+-binding EF-hand superfamily protein